MKIGSLAYPLTLALLLSPGALQATTPVSGNLRNLGTLPPGASVFVRFTLRGCQGAAPTVPNVAMLAGPGQPYFQDFVADVNGVITGTLYSTRDATGNSGGEIECPNNVFTASWYGMTIWFQGKSGPEMAVHARNGVTLDPSSVTPLAGNPVIIAPTGDTVYARLDGGNQPFSGNVTAPRLISTVATGTAPLGVTSTTVVPNLNAALLNGQPGVVYSTASASTNASISAVTMATASGSGNTYRFSLYIDQTVAGASCGSTTTITPNLIFTDAAASGPLSQGMSNALIGGNGAPGAVVQYSVTYSAGGSCAPGPSYQIYPVLVQLQ